MHEHAEYCRIHHVHAFYMLDGKLRHSANFWRTVTKFSDNISKTKGFVGNLIFLYSVTPRYPRWPPFAYIRPWRPSLISRGHRVQNFYVNIKEPCFASVVRKFRHCTPNISRMAQLSIQHLKYGLHHGSGKNSIL